jgi:hypothetical protein
MNPTDKTPENDRHENPNQRLASTDRPKQVNYGILVVCVKSVFAILSVIGFAYILLVLHTNYLVYTRKGGSDLQYLTLLVALVVSCAAGSVYSMRQWRSGRIVPSIVLLLLTLGGLFVGPWILAIVMFGAPT